MKIPTTPFLENVSPQEMQLDRRRWKAVLDQASQFVESGEIPALALQVQRKGLTCGPQLFGTRTLAGEGEVNSQTRFLIASITKPMVAMAVLQLVERGQIALNQRIADILPEFKGPQKRQITVKHLLTHTSGLPDMLPNNRELRANNCTLDDFVRATAQTDLVFPTGHDAQYQSMGFALLGPLISTVSGQHYQQFVREELFRPLGMKRSELGLPDEEVNDDNVAEVRVPDDQIGEDHWNWNSPYWKSFGAPWGGTLSTVQDVSAFCRCMLNGGRTPTHDSLFHGNTIRMATTNRLHDFPDLPEPVRRARGWGYGWRLNWKDRRSSFGDLLDQDVFGHWGATGTVCWMDPQTETAVVILSTQPYRRSSAALTRLSNMLTAALDA